MNQWHTFEKSERLTNLGLHGDIIIEEGCTLEVQSLILYEDTRIIGDGTIRVKNTIKHYGGLVACRDLIIDRDGCSVPAGKYNVVNFIVDCDGPLFLSGDYFFYGSLITKPHSYLMTKAHTQIFVRGDLKICYDSVIYGDTPVILFGNNNQSINISSMLYALYANKRSGKLNIFSDIGVRSNITLDLDSIFFGGSCYCDNLNLYVNKIWCGKDIEFAINKNCVLYSRNPSKLIGNNTVFATAQQPQLINLSPQSCRFVNGCKCFGGRDLGNNINTLFIGLFKEQSQNSFFF